MIAGWRMAADWDDGDIAAFGSGPRGTPEGDLRVVEDDAPRWTGVLTCPVIIVRQDAPQDALTAPTAETLAPQILAMLPRGAAWAAADGAATDPDSRIGRYWRALAAPLADLFAAIGRVAAESTGVTLEASLDDWEAELGLPDACGGDPSGEVGRRRMVRARVAMRPVIRPAHYMCLAQYFGVEIWLEEMRAFRVGVSRIDTPLWDGRAEWVFKVFVTGLGDPVPFRVGSGGSRVGVNRLMEYPIAADLECAIRRVAPAETTPVFVYV